jgi:hypothetical protein
VMSTRACFDWMVMLFVVLHCFLTPNQSTKDISPNVGTLSPTCG